MRPIRSIMSVDWKSACGLAMAAALLALSTPGVQVVRAQDVLVSEIAAGQTCEATDAGPNITAEMMIEQLRRAQAETEPSADGPIVLNNRGYNYGPPPAIDPLIYRRVVNRQR